MFCAAAIFFQFETAEHHVEGSGKKDRKRTSGGEIEASVFEIKKFEREAISHVGSRYTVQPGDMQVGLEF